VRWAELGPNFSLTAGKPAQRDRRRLIAGFDRSRSGWSPGLLRLLSPCS